MEMFFSNIQKNFSLDYIPHNHTFLFEIFGSFNMLSSSFRTLADLGLEKLHAITSLMLNWSDCVLILLPSEYCLDFLYNR